MTMKELAQQAIDIQDACNVSGLVHAWSRAATELRQHLNDTEEFNTHPVNQLWASKLVDLTRIGQADWDKFSIAYDACMKLAQGE